LISLAGKTTKIAIAKHKSSRLSVIASYIKIAKMYFGINHLKNLKKSDLLYMLLMTNPNSHDGANF
jgi:hypothetical protein